MISKKIFREVIIAIKSQEDYNDRLNTLLEEQAYGYCTFSGGNGIVNILLELLKEIFNDKSDWIGWYLYETSTFRIEIDGVTREISTPESLYDFLLEEIKEVEIKED